LSFNADAARFAAHEASFMRARGRQARFARRRKCSASRAERFNADAARFAAHEASFMRARGRQARFARRRKCSASRAERFNSSG